MKKAAAYLISFLMLLSSACGAVEDTSTPAAVDAAVENDAADGGRSLPEDDQSPASDALDDFVILRGIGAAEAYFRYAGADTQAVRRQSRYSDGAEIKLDPEWEFADCTVINSGAAVMYLARVNRRGITVGVNAGHGTNGGGKAKTFCHPDKSPKLTGGTTAMGSIMAVAVSSGIDLSDGTPEKDVTLRMAQLFRNELLRAGYDVLMIRDGDDVQLDNIARAVICNNAADCHISLHWDGDGLSYDKGCFYMSVPDGLKKMYPVSAVWQRSELLGDSLIAGLRSAGAKIWKSGSEDMDLTQTSYSTVPSVSIELGNQSSVHDDKTLKDLARGLCAGVEEFFGRTGETY